MKYLILMGLSFLGLTVFAEVTDSPTQIPVTTNGEQVSTQSFDKYLAWSGNPDANRWTSSVESYLESSGGRNILNPPAAVMDQVVGVCPNYKSMNEKEKEFFWINLASYVAKTESGLNPQRIFTAPEATSAGLYGVILNHNGCDIKTVEESKDLFRGSACFFKSLYTDFALRKCLFCKDDATQDPFGYPADLHRPQRHAKIKKYLSQFPPCKTH